MAFVPVLNSAFQMLNSSIYYARWYYMLVLMLTLATIRAFESHQSDWGRAVKWSTGITLAMTVLIGFMPKITTVTTNDVETDEWSIGIAGDTRRFWIYALIAVVCILGFVLIFKNSVSIQKHFILQQPSHFALQFCSQADLLSAREPHTVLP